MLVLNIVRSLTLLRRTLEPGETTGRERHGSTLDAEDRIFLSGEKRRIRAAAEILLLRRHSNWILTRNGRLGDLALTAKLYYTTEEIEAEKKLREDTRKEYERIKEETQEIDARLLQWEDGQKGKVLFNGRMNSLSFKDAERYYTREDIAKEAARR